MLEIKYGGKVYKTPIKYLEVGNQYVVEIEGLRIFINVSVERPALCSEAQSITKLLGMGL